MSVSIIQTKEYQGSYAASHTISALNASGTDTLVVACGFNRNPTSDVSGWTIGGAAPTSQGSDIQTNVCAVDTYSKLINNASVDVVSNTPSYKLQSMIAIALAGVDQSTPIVQVVHTQGYGTTPQQSVTGTAGNKLITFIGLKSDFAVTPVSDTELVDTAHTDANMGQFWAGHQDASGSAQTVGGTISSNDNWCIITLEVAAAGTPTARRRIIIS